MAYLVVKWLHVLSSTLLFGTGIGSAFYLLVASLHRDARVVAVVARYVVLADWLFTATTAVFQPLSGFWLVRWAGIPWRGGWVGWSVALYAVAIACWLPVVLLQMRMRGLAAHACAEAIPLPPAYWRAFRLWVALGVPAFLAFLAVFYLMVVKPPL
ncbi:DUF2269 domain-containing protein [Fulvimonas yonginensis]|uniref:DUF2269 domain-containing protein n=1 Tax=Fulvimonas yonginensis TaxID=1495200 RepID=A0ABU8JGB7_9GAMM